jgi:hypothetical protein
MTHYRTLGLTTNATDAEIKNRYRQLAKQYHPDRNQGDVQAEERFKAINEAYRVLSNANERELYNAQLIQWVQSMQQGASAAAASATASGAAYSRVRRRYPPGYRPPGYVPYDHTERFKLKNIAKEAVGTLALLLVISVIGYSFFAYMQHITLKKELQQAETLYQAKKYKEALANCLNALKRDEDHPKVNLLTALIYRQKEEKTEFYQVHIVRAARGKDTFTGEELLQLADLQLEANYITEATDTYNYLLQHKPALVVESRLGLARLQLEYQHRYPAVLATLALLDVKALTANKKAAYYLISGIAHQQLEHWQQANRALAQVYATADPAYKGKGAYYLAVQQLLQKADTAAACSWFIKAHHLGVKAAGEQYIMYCSSES